MSDDHVASNLKSMDDLDFDYSLARDVLHLSVTDAMGHGVATASPRRCAWAACVTPAGPVGPR